MDFIIGETLKFTYFRFFIVFIVFHCFVLFFIVFCRYLSVCHPLRFHGIKKEKNAKIGVACIVLLAFLISSPILFEADVIEEVDPVTNTTTYRHKYKNYRDDMFHGHIWAWGKEIVGRLFPILCVVTLNPLILVAHRRSLTRRAAMQSRPTHEERKQSKEERRLIILLLSVSFVFLVTTLPASVLQVYQTVNF